jgi:hypothetical protein
MYRSESLWKIFVATPEIATVERKLDAIAKQ